MIAATSIRGKALSTGVPSPLPWKSGSGGLQGKQTATTTKLSGISINTKATGKRNGTANSSDVRNPEKNGARGSDVTKSSSSSSIQKKDAAHGKAGLSSKHTADGGSSSSGAGVLKGISCSEGSGAGNADVAGSNTSSGEGLEKSEFVGAAKQEAVACDQGSNRSRGTEAARCASVLPSAGSISSSSGAAKEAPNKTDDYSSSSTANAIPASPSKASSSTHISGAVVGSPSKMSGNTSSSSAADANTASPSKASGSSKSSSTASPSKASGSSKSSTTAQEASGLYSQLQCVLAAFNQAEARGCRCMADLCYNRGVVAVALADFSLAFKVSPGVASDM